MLRIGWFSTGRGEGSRDLLRFVYQRLADEGMDICIDFVFSNRERGEAEGSDAFFSLVDSYQLPLITHSSAAFRRRVGGPFAQHRAVYDAEVLALLSERRPDICVLAGYMLIASSHLCRTLPLLNLHPALPDGPIGTWQEVVWQLIERRATRTGAMMHMATEEVDRGPLVSYVTVPLDIPELQPLWRAVEGSSVDKLKSGPGEEHKLFRRIRALQYSREPYLLFETLRALSTGDISLDASAVGREVSVAAGEPTDPLGYGATCLDLQVETAMLNRDRRPGGCQPG